MVDLSEAVEEFMQRDEYETFHHPAAINSGLCEEFADFVQERYYSDLQRMTTFDVVEDASNYPSTAAGTIEPWHVWLTDGTLHYDAESPCGVSYWEDLHLFETHPLSDYREEG